MAELVRLTGKVQTPTREYSFAEHDVIIRAISERDRKGAAEAMAGHLRTTTALLLDT